MSDDLMMPQVPEPEPDDPEDVSWALSTAEAMWARGDHSEGIKWVRRAAEAASEAENDARALTLAKVAADLTNMLARMTHASIDLEEEITPMTDPPPPPLPVRPMVVGKPAPKAGGAPAAPVAKTTSSAAATAKVTTPSRAPAPLPSKTSQPPPAMGVGAVGRAASNKPLGAATAIGATKAPASIRPGAQKQDKKDTAKKSRRSRDNLDAFARAAGSGSEPSAQDERERAAEAAMNVLSSDTAETAAINVPLMMKRRQEDPTVASNVNDILDKAAARLEAQMEDGIEEMGKSTDEWDASPTQNLAGEELPFPHFPSTTAAGSGRASDRSPASGTPPATDFKATMQSFPRPAAGRPAAATGGQPSPSTKLGGAAATSSTSGPATVAGVGLSGGLSALTGAAASRAGGSSAPTQKRPDPNEKHDPKIMTTQAVRVVVWRDANGVHVAPAGTVVSAITVEAVLVALEPNADLTAWLSATK